MAWFKECGANCVADLFLIYDSCLHPDDLPESERRRANRLGHYIGLTAIYTLFACAIAGLILAAVDYARSKADTSVGLVFSVVAVVLLALASFGYTYYLYRSRQFCSVFYRRRERHITATYGALERHYSSDDDDDAYDDSYDHDGAPNGRQQARHPDEDDNAITVV